MTTETKTFTLRQKISWALAIIATLILVFLVITFSNDRYANVTFSLGLTAFALAFVSILLHRKNILGWTVFVVFIVLITLGVIAILQGNIGLPPSRR